MAILDCIFLSKESDGIKKAGVTPAFFKVKKINEPREPLQELLRQLYVRQPF